MPTVFVISEDWTLRAAVRAELLEHGIDAQGFETPEQAASAATLPDVVVLDAARARLDDAKVAPLVRRAGVLVIASGIEPPPAVPPGAVVLRRPVQVSQIVASVRQILAGQLA